MHQILDLIISNENLGNYASINTKTNVLAQSEVVENIIWKFVVCLFVSRIFHKFPQVFKVEFLWVLTTESAQFLGRGRVAARGLYRRRVGQ